MRNKVLLRVPDALNESEKAVMKKILVIDDAPFILESTSTLLMFEGYEVVTATNGEEGVAKALEILPDLILCDISMPKLDGYGVLEHVRKAKETQMVPFIFLTAFTEKQNMRIGMEKGADDFLIKPYTREELIGAIEMQWKKHNLIENQAQEKVEEVGKNVTYALPHEFRTALNEINGSANFLKSTAGTLDKDEIESIADDIVFSANRLMKITENFLAYSQIEAIANDSVRRAELRTMRTVEPSTSLADIAELIAQRFGRTADLEVSEVVDGVYIEISTEYFTKILDELIDNAFRFSEKGQHVIISSFVDDKEMFVLSIQDFGRGMTKAQIQNIAALAQFERTTYEQQGAGLGLVIAKKYTELHDGQFMIKSVEGFGTLVTVGLHCNKL